MERDKRKGHLRFVLVGEVLRLLQLPRAYQLPHRPHQCALCILITSLKPKHGHATRGAVKQQLRVCVATFHHRKARSRVVPLSASHGLK